MIRLMNYSLNHNRKIRNMKRLLIKNIIMRLIKWQ